MAPPKRRVSKSKKNMRRSHLARTLPASSTCSRCGQTKLPHRVCIHCGHYKDKEIVKMDNY